MSADYSSLLERTRNLLSNHRIPIQKSTDLSSLSLASRKLARGTELSQQQEHVAQLFFAQRGYDLSRHLDNVLSTRVEPRANRGIKSIDFDIDEHLDNQQALLGANLLQSQLSHHHIATTEMFSSSLCNDWHNSKNAILQSMTYNIGLPTPNDPTNENNANNNFSNPLSIPDSYSNQFTTTQDYYAQVVAAFTQKMHMSHLDSDAIGLKEAILELPQQLLQISRDLEQIESITPLSTDIALGLDGKPLPSHQQSSQNNNDSNPMSLLRQHEQSSEFWMWFDSLSRVLVCEHTKEEELKQQAQLNQSQLSQQQSTSSKLQYRYKNWFLPTSSRHGVMATVDYLQQCWLEHMGNVMAQDQTLSAQYNDFIETVSDDNLLMIELATLYTRSREFKTRFFMNTNNPNVLNNSTNALVSLTSANNPQTGPNIDISASNPWSVVYACIRAGYYQAAVVYLTQLNDTAYSEDVMNTRVLIQILQLYADQQINSPVVELELPEDLWAQLYREMNTITTASQGDNNSNGNIGDNTIFQNGSSLVSNPFRKVVYSTLGHFPLVAPEMKGLITPYVLTTIEDFLWYRLRLITQQSLPQSLLDSYRILSQTAGNSTSIGLNTTIGDSSSGSLLDQLSLINLQTSILTRGKGYFTGVGNGGNSNLGGNNNNISTGGLLYVHILFMTQQFERAIIEFYSINPILALHLALLCLLFGLIRTTDMHSELCIPIHLGVKTLQALQSIQSSTNSSAMATSPAQLGYTTMNQTLHTRYAINVFKLLSNYIQTIQSHRVDHAVSYAYTTRFIPLFGNISLYSHYISNNSSTSTQQQLDTTLNTSTAFNTTIANNNNTTLDVNGKDRPQHNLVSLEYTINMVFNASIPKNLLHLYQTTVLNLNAPISNLILTHDKVTMTPLQYQQYYFHNQERKQAKQELDDPFFSPSNIGLNPNNTFLSMNDHYGNIDNSDDDMFGHNQQQLNQFNPDKIALNTTLGGGNPNLTNLGIAQFLSKTPKGLYNNISNACGVELPIIIDLLLLNKVDAPILLGQQRTIYTVAQTDGGNLDKTNNANNGALGIFYTTSVIAAIVQLALSRDKQQ